MSAAKFVVGTVAVIVFGVVASMVAALVSALRIDSSMYHE